MPPKCRQPLETPGPSVCTPEAGGWPPAGTGRPRLAASSGRHEGLHTAPAPRHGQPRTPLSSLGRKSSRCDYVWAGGGWCTLFYNVICSPKFSQWAYIIFVTTATGCKATPKEAARAKAAGCVCAAAVIVLNPLRGQAGQQQSRECPSS